MVIFFGILGVVIIVAMCLVSHSSGKTEENLKQKDEMATQLNCVIAETNKVLGTLEMLVNANNTEKVIKDIVIALKEYARLHGVAAELAQKYNELCDAIYANLLRQGQIANIVDNGSFGIGSIAFWEDSKKATSGVAIEQLRNPNEIIYKAFEILNRYKITQEANRG